MYIKIPFLSKSEDAEPLKRAIESACSKAGLSQYTATIFLTHFLEEVARQVSMGRVVNIPGFGVFGPFLDERRSSVGRWGEGRSKPVFSAARGFREEIRWSGPHHPDVKKKIIRHRRNHALGSGESSSGSRVFTAMNAIREDIAAQLNGVELED